MKDVIDNNILLSREDFKKLGFSRTGGKCCVSDCNEGAADAHHIMDRKLWKDGGYYLSNCAPLCSKHHLEAEKGIIKPNQLAEYLNIKTEQLKKPEFFDWLTDDEYKEMFINEELDKFGRYGTD